MNIVFKLSLLVSALVLSACNPSSSHQDLRDFIAENKQRPPGAIKAPPKIEPYTAFEYDAYRLRSPFALPLAEFADPNIVASSNVKPDPERVKERLEQFDLSAIKMVGTLTTGDVLWALIEDPDQSIERVKVGNFIGRNHGKIVEVVSNKINLIEIVASGGGWIERPNVMELNEVDVQ